MRPARFQAPVRVCACLCVCVRPRAVGNGRQGCPLNPGACGHVSHPSSSQHALHWGALSLILEVPGPGGLLGPPVSALHRPHRAGRRWWAEGGGDQAAKWGRGLHPLPCLALLACPLAAGLRVPVPWTRRGALVPSDPPPGCRRGPGCSAQSCSPEPRVLPLPPVGGVFFSG